MKTSIKVQEEMKKKLSIKKYAYDLKSLDDVIEGMYRIIEDNNLWNELKLEKGE